MASQAALRDCFIKKHPNLRYGLGEWRRYSAGIWEPVSELAVKGLLQDIIPTKDLTSALVNSIADLTKATTYIPDRLFDANPNILTFTNTCLDLTNFNTVAPSPEYYATSKLAFDYDPKAESKAWTTFLKIAPYPDFLQEFAGYCLTPETKYEIAVWLHGPPGGGKSTFIAGLEAMLGPRCCILGLHEIERSSFALSQIIGKTLATSTEQPSHHSKAAYMLNGLISGETLVVNRKFRDHISLVPRVKLLWAMNDLPQFGAGSSGIFRRVLPIFWEGLAEAERLPEIKEEIMGSGMSIVNWALVGLARLRARGRFDIPPALIASRELYRTQSDITLGFLEECYDRVEDSEIASNSLYDTYDKWCVKNGHHPLASNRFAMELQRLGLTKNRKSIGVFWQGIEQKVEFPDIIIDSDA